MPTLSEKTLKTLRLTAAGYAYNFDRMMYINRQAKKAFSIEFIDDNPESVIASRIHEPNREQDWCFYTSLTMSKGVEKELKRVLQ
jgi:hypothetical protein